jgi:hypothetical protein
LGDKLTGEFQRATGMKQTCVGSAGVYPRYKFKLGQVLKTLEDVVDHYDKGGIANPQLDEEIFPLKLTAQEKADLVTFMKEGLSSSDYPDIAPPKLP